MQQNQLMTNTKYMTTINANIKQNQLITNTKYINTIYANIKTKAADDKY